MTSAIMNPLRPQEIEAVHAANVLMGTDANCQNWIMTYRDHTPAAAGSAATAPAAAGSGGGRRRGGREARRRAQ
jgi:5-methyltetrahydrofolate--homocysteine methyltransferase